MLPTIICPNCHRDLKHYDRYGVEKHLNACTRHTSQYICTGRPRGRPKKS